MDAIVRPPLPSMLPEALPNSRAPAPRALPRLLATSGPSATLSSSADFPGHGYTAYLLRRFRGGTRRASPVAAPRVLVTVPSLPPRRRGVAASAGLRRSLLPSRGQDTLGLRAWRFRGYLCVHSRYGPATRSPSFRWLGRWAPGFGFPPPCHPSSGRLALCSRRPTSSARHVCLRSHLLRQNPVLVILPLNSLRRVTIARPAGLLG